MKRDLYKSKTYVIDASGRLPAAIRLRDLFLTFFVWAIYLYFMKDTIAFSRDAVIWISHGFDDFSKYPGLKTLPDIVAFIRMGAVFSAMLVGWSYYNILRYGKRKRRRGAGPIEIDRIARDYEVESSEVKAWQNAHILTMYHDKVGRLYKVTKD